VLHFLDLSGVKHLLDVGGGPGTYATLLAQKYPELRITVLDLPAVAAIAQELISGAGVSDRVHILTGDAVTDDYGTQTFDGVLFSGVLHQMSAATIRQMFANAYRALLPDGRMIVSDMMLQADKTQPVFSTLFSLQMLLTSEEGAVFSADECKTWLEETGFTTISAQTLPPPLPIR